MPGEMLAMIASDGPLEKILRHDRAITAAGLALVTLLSWLYLLSGAGMGMGPFEMTRLSLLPNVYGPGLAVEHGMSMPAGVWGVNYWLIMIAMWWVMMIAMMTPSATPMMSARIASRSGRGDTRESGTLAVSVTSALPV